MATNISNHHNHQPPQDEEKEISITAMYRTINVDTWDDPWFAELEPNAKLLFLYLLTNRRTTPCGAFEITFRQMAFETGLDVPTVKAIIPTLAPKIVWWPEHQVCLIANFYRHQRANSNPHFCSAAAKSLNEFPAEVYNAVCLMYPDIANRVGWQGMVRTDGEGAIPMTPDTDTYDYDMPQEPDYIATPIPPYNQGGATPIPPLSHPHPTQVAPTWDGDKVTVTVTATESASETEESLKGRDGTKTHNAALARSAQAQAPEGVGVEQQALIEEAAPEPEPEPEPDYGFDAFFDEFWKLYPSRDGKSKPGKGETRRLAQKLPAKDRELVLTATRHYVESGRLPVDPIRFFKSRDYPGGFWREWIEPPAKGTSRRLTLTSYDIFTQQPSPAGGGTTGYGASRAERERQSLESNLRLAQAFTDPEAGD